MNLKLKKKKENLAAEPSQIIAKNTSCISLLKKTPFLLQGGIFTVTNF